MTMTRFHLIKPPPHLITDWLEEAYRQNTSNKGTTWLVADQAAQYGADRELDACCEWLNADPELAQKLRAARRPNPLSLKEQALAVLDDIANVDTPHHNTIRRALEHLPDDA